MTYEEARRVSDEIDRARFIPYVNRTTEEEWFVRVYFKRGPGWITVELHDAADWRGRLALEMLK